VQSVVPSSCISSPKLRKLKLPAKAALPAILKN
jgi:hypothetical protein